MSTVNDIKNLGRLTSDPELKTLPNGTSLCQLSIATNHKYKDRDGNVKESVCFLKWKLWGKTADNAGKYLRKGHMVYLSGRLDQETWEDQTGKKRSQHVGVCEKMVFMPNNKTADQPASAASPSQSPGVGVDVSEDFPDDDIPF